MRPGVCLNLQISKELRQRTRDVAKRLVKTSTDIARDALIKEVEYLEHKFRQEDLAKAEAEHARKAARNGGTPRRNIGKTDAPRGLSGLLPDIPLATQARMSAVAPDPYQDPTEKLYRQQARYILDGDKSKVRERAMQAVAIIKRERPLTSPPEEQIIAKLEAYMLEFRDEAEHMPKTHTVDDLVGTVIDISKIKTAGSTEKPDV